MVCLKGKKGKERIEVNCSEDDFTAEYAKLMREGYTISITKAQKYIPKSITRSNGE